jgi:hypothetical protein
MEAQLCPLTDPEIDWICGGLINISVTGPTISPAITVQTNVANQVANSILSSSVITQIIGQVNVG